MFIKNRMECSINSSINMYKYKLNVIKCKKKSKKNALIIYFFEVKPYNDQEFCKRSKGRGPKSFAWSYDDDKV